MFCTIGDMCSVTSSGCGGTILGSGGHVTALWKAVVVLVIIGVSHDSSGSTILLRATF